LYSARFKLRRESTKNVARPPNLIEQQRNARARMIERTTTTYSRSYADTARSRLMVPRPLSAIVGSTPTRGSPARPLFISRQTISAPHPPYTTGRQDLRSVACSASLPPQTLAARRLRRHRFAFLPKTSQSSLQLSRLSHQRIQLPASASNSSAERSASSPP